ncbi:MAG: cyclic nucleotide-binding domain-containing protein [Mycobacteriales bacterium]
MRTIVEELPEHPFFAGLDDAAIALLAGCAVNVHFGPGELLFREGEAADRFFVLRRGRVAIEVHSPTGGIVLDTADDGDVVGWSWLVPPHRWVFDARAVTSTSALALDAVCLRGKCDSDPALGYALMQRVSGVMYERLQAARIRLLDLYGGPRDRDR